MRRDRLLTGKQCTDFRIECVCNFFQNSTAGSDALLSGRRKNADSVKPFLRQANFSLDYISPPSIVVVLTCHDHSPNCYPETLSTKDVNEFRYPLK